MAAVPDASAPLPQDLATPPKYLILDCGSITNADATADLDALCTAMTAATPADAKRGMNEAWSDSRSNPDMDAKRYWTKALAGAGVAAADIDDAAVERCEKCVHQILATTYHETLTVAAKLKAKGLMVGIISNHITSPPWFQVCAEAAKLYELASHNSLVVVSQDARCAKPDPAIFNLFLEKLRALEPTAQPSELLFCDDKEKNVNAALSLGWRGLVFNASTAAEGAFAAALAEFGL